MLGDMNAKVGGSEQDGVVGQFGVPGMNTNGECLVEMCAERGLICVNTWFQKKMIHKYTWEREHKYETSLIYYVLTERRFKNRIIDVSVCKGAAEEMSDHYLVEGKVRMEGYPKDKRRLMEDKKVVRVS